VFDAQKKITSLKVRSAFFVRLFCSRLLSSQIVPISKSSAEQRKGRAGRTSEGKRCSSWKVMVIIANNEIAGEFKDRIDCLCSIHFLRHMLSPVFAA
jgi:hypothetical protein